MNYKKYIKNNKLILPKGFNSYLSCSNNNNNNNLSELILPEGFNSNLFCHNNNSLKLLLPEGFNSNLFCHNNNLNELPEVFNLNWFIILMLVLK